jgi:mRNA interferase MazF
MHKDFDQWNNLKKNLHNKGENKFYHPRDIWWCNLGVNVSFEQDGSGAEYERPVVIIRGFSLQVCLIVPLTTSRKENPYYVPIGLVEGKNAQAIILQVRLIDTKRLSDKIGWLEADAFEEIIKAVKGLL